jgi:hypothetical protein
LQFGDSRGSRPRTIHMDDTTSIWDVMAARAAVGSLAVADGEAGEPREAGTRPAVAASSYLAISGKDCDGEKRERREKEKRYEVAACGCRSWFCPRCCVGRGLSLRQRLIPILHTFTGILMWTFTIDPTLFESPAAAYEYVKRKRCISNVIRRLRERGHLHSDRYICLVEWQKKSEMPHFHVLVDAGFTPFDEVCELWNRYRPAEAGPIQGDRPGFGSVRFSAPKFRSAVHAARYGCKYLIKHPGHGYPDWVLDSRGEVHRYSTSRGFWDGPDEPVQPGAADGGDPTRNAELGAGDDESAPESETPNRAVDRHFELKTVRERLANCGRSCVVLQLTDVVDTRTGEVTVERRFMAAIFISVGEAASIAGERLPEGKRRFVLDAAGVAKVVRFDRVMRRPVTVEQGIRVLPKQCG